jgi:hypothetical protein
MQRTSANKRQKRQGSILIYAVFSVTALVCVISLAVDFGRVAIAKTELMMTADSAARAGAAQLVDNPGGATNACLKSAELNSADGTAVTLIPGQDITYGNWSEAFKVFTVSGSPTNAVRVTARRIASRNSSVPTVFAGMLGRASTDVTATSTAAVVTTPIPSQVTNKSNPWLAGMPSGTTANGYDSAPTASPTLLVSGGLVAGAELTLDATGATSNQEGVEEAYAPDGNLNWIIHNYAGAEHGLANLKAPISGLIGVFLSDSAPNLSYTPSSLDFTSAASRDFASLSPALKQPFFIGDAKKADGTVQKFVVPPGATRLYVGSMDGQQWSDNAGGFSVTVTSGVTIYRISTVE